MNNDKLIHRRISRIVKMSGEKAHRIVLDMKAFAVGKYLGVGTKSKGKSVEISSAVKKMNVGLFELGDVQKLEGKVVSFENQ